MTLSNPDFVFVLGTAGVLLIYGEFIWVGRLIFGVAGSICLLLAVASLLKAADIQHSSLFFLASSACFVVEASVKTWFTAGIAGTLLLAYGGFILGVSVPVLLSSTFIFSVISIVLAANAKRARQNKLSDIT